MDDDLLAAIAASHLRGVAPGTLTSLLDGADTLTILPATFTHWQGDATPHLELVVSGVVRVFVTAPDGRTMTIRYCRRGALLGAMSLFTRPFSMPATTQALAPTTLVRIAPRRVRDLLGDPEVARALHVELGERAREFLDEIAGNAFASVRQRVVRHLLDLASERARSLEADELRGRVLVARVTQQELAEAAGTAREVVVRTLRELREDGLVGTDRAEIRLLDPVGLLAEEEWNLSS